MLENGLTIGEAASRVGVPASTLRYWESIGLLTAPQRVAGKRRYDSQTMQRMIVLIKRTGFTLEETQTILRGLSDKTPPPPLWRELAQRKLPKIEQTLTEARVMKEILEQGLQCDCLTLEDCLGQLEVAQKQA
jgi:MerR family redox-sensitive transcriptional activator SoxR